MSKTDNWMPLYLGDYMSDTMHLNGAQHGAYLLLLMHYWRNGPLPDDDAQLATIARTELKAWKAAIGPVVRAFFRLIDGALHQKRMDKERDRWFDISSKRRDAGKAGAYAKHNGKHPPDKPPGNRVANARHLPDCLSDKNWQMPEICHGSASTPLPLPKKELLKSFEVVEEISAREGKSEPDTAWTAPADELIGAMAKRMFSNYPPRAPKLTPEQQREAVAPTVLARPKPAHLTREQINASLRKTA